MMWFTPSISSTSATSSTCCMVHGVIFLTVYTKANYLFPAVHPQRAGSIPSGHCWGISKHFPALCSLFFSLPCSPDTPFTSPHPLLTHMPSPPERSGSLSISHVCTLGTRLNPKVVPD